MACLASLSEKSEPVLISLKINVSVVFLSIPNLAQAPASLKINKFRSPVLNASPLLVSHFNILLKVSLYSVFSVTSTLSTFLVLLKIVAFLFITISGS